MTAPCLGKVTETGDLKCKFMVLIVDFFNGCFLLSWLRF